MKNEAKQDFHSNQECMSKMKLYHTVQKMVLQQLKEDLKSLDNAIIYCPSIVQRTKDAKGQVQLIEVWSQIITQKRFQDQNWQQIRMEALENETRVLTKHNISLLRWVNLQPVTQNRGQGSPNST